MKKAVRRLRDRAVRALHGVPSSVIVAYRQGLEEAGVEPRVLDAYGPRGLAALAPYEHRRLLASGLTRAFTPTPRPPVDRPAGARPRMLLHIGALKTGTTATQLVMHGDRARLWEHGVLYPSPTAFFGPQNHEGHNGLLAPLKAPRSAKSVNLDAFRRYLLGLADGADLTVLSSEGLYGAIEGHHGLVSPEVSSRSYWQRRRAFVKELAAVTAGFDVTVVVWLRRADTFADSLYRQAVKFNLPSSGDPASAPSRHYAGTFSEFRTALAPFWEYDRQIALLEEAFGDVTVHRFEDGGVVETMYEHLGIAPPDAARGHRANASADGRVALWLSGNDAGTLRQREEFGWSAEAVAALKEGSGGSLWESDDERAVFLAELPSARFGADFFPEPEPLVSSARLTDGDAARLTAAFDLWRESHPESEFTDVPESAALPKPRS